MNKSLMRVIMFVVICVGLIYWLSSQIEESEAGEVKSSFYEIDGLPQLQEKTKLGVLGETIDQAIPETVKLQFEKASEKIFKTGEKVIEETEMVQEIKKTIETAAEQISGFPDKQKKDVKKEVIKQVCDQLMEEYN